MKKYYFIYDVRQANYYLKNGVELVEVGAGKKGDAYFKFIRNEHTEKVFAEWAKNRDSIIQEMYK